MEAALRLEFPGLCVERYKSGNKCYRVRIEGNPKRKITLPIDPDHGEFQKAYNLARKGIEYTPPPEEDVIKGSFKWLVDLHLRDMERRVKAGLYSPLTLKKRTNIFTKLLEKYKTKNAVIPTHHLIDIRDEHMETPAYADSVMEAIRVMYRWGMETKQVTSNPAIGVPTIDKGKGGAVAWSSDDLRQFKEKHPFGTTPYLLLTILMFTGCRIGDAIWIGREQEFMDNGLLHLGWLPRKKGSAFVEIPICDPLYRATRESKVQGRSYLLKQNGQPFATSDAMGTNLKKWCNRAGLENRTAHGVRKGAAQLLAESGCTQYQIMSILGHTEAKTSEVYTKGAQRRKLAQEAMKSMANLEW